MTAQDLIRSALVMTGALAQGESPSNADAEDAFERLNRMVAGWANQRLTIFVTARNVYSLVAGQQAYTIGPGGNFNQARPQFLTYAGLILTSSNPDVEIPLDIWTIKDWFLQSVKDQTSTLPTAVYYDTAYPSTGVSAGLGVMRFWPVPTQVNQVALYTPTQLAEFADLSTDYSFPPGYADALEYNLAKRLIQSGMGLREHLADIDPMARETLATIKRANIQPIPASVDPALWPSRPGFNWRTGQ
jgi:hypothetical protein